MVNLKVITSTTREGRLGRSIAEWITGLAKETNKYDVELVDLLEINLPFMDEPNHPMHRKYVHEHTKSWSRMIEPAESFIFVLAEYNAGFPAPLKNAFDYLHHEWKYKPLGIVSYGSESGGERSSLMIRQVVSKLNVVPIAEQVTIPYIFRFLDENHRFCPDEKLEQSAEILLKELYRWSRAMTALRVPELTA